MRRQIPERRDFLAGLGLMSVAGMAGCTSLQKDSGAGVAPLGYGLSPGLAYLNTASVGPTSRAVLERVIEAWRQVETNPVRMTYGDGDVLVASDGVRENAALFLGCDIDELTITRSTTEAMNTIAQSILLERGDRVLTTNHEHHGGQLCWEYLARKRGVELDVLQIPLTEHDPIAIIRRFEAGITPRTRIISVSHVFTTNGLRVPVKEIAALARTHNALCIVDGAQAVGQIPVDVREIGCHAYAATGHKWLMGPKGTGFLYISADAADRIEPIQRQDGARFVNNAIGVGNLPLVVGLGAAIEAMQEQGMEAVEKRVLELRALAYEGLSSISRLRVVSPASGNHASALVAARLPDDVPAAPFHVMLRDKYSLMTKRVEDHYFNGIRVSPHIFNTEHDIGRVIAAFRSELD